MAKRRPDVTDEEFEAEKRLDGIEAWRIQSSLMKDVKIRNRKPNITLSAAQSVYEGAFGKPSIMVMGDKNNPVMLEFAVVHTEKEYNEITSGQYRQLPEGSDTDTSSSVDPSES